jgi:hypothetical protein
MEQTHPCPAVLGGCGGKGVVRGDKGLCPRCLALATGGK